MVNFKKLNIKNLTIRRNMLPSHTMDRTQAKRVVIRLRNYFWWHCYILVAFILVTLRRSHHFVDKQSQDTFLVTSHWKWWQLQLEFKDRCVLNLGSSVDLCLEVAPAGPNQKQDCERGNLNSNFSLLKIPFSLGNLPFFDPNDLDMTSKWPYIGANGRFLV